MIYKRGCDKKGLGSSCGEVRQRPVVWCLLVQVHVTGQAGSGIRQAGQ